MGSQRRVKPFCISVKPTPKTSANNSMDPRGPRKQFGKGRPAHGTHQHHTAKPHAPISPMPDQDESEGVAHVQGQAHHNSKLDDKKPRAIGQRIRDCRRLLKRVFVTMYIDYRVRPEDAGVCALMSGGTAADDQGVPRTHPGGVVAATARRSQEPIHQQGN